MDKYIGFQIDSKENLVPLMQVAEKTYKEISELVRIFICWFC